jgi:hypothetical protein
VTIEHRGPGLVKTQRAPLIERKVRECIRCTDYRWRELFEKADVVSEGAIRRDNDGPTYYGSTHIRLAAVVNEGPNAQSEITLLRRSIRVDPHVRLRAIRLACLEAQVRSNAELTSIRTEIGFGHGADDLCISVDVEAKLVNLTVIERRRVTGHRGRT